MTTAGLLTRKDKTSRQRGVLCGTDFSTNSEHAMRAAGAIAKKLDEPIELIHAVEMPQLGASHNKVLKFLTTSRQQDLRVMAKNIRAKGVDVKEHVVAGKADEVLTKETELQNPRLLVVASAGYRGTERWFVGSVSERVASCTTVPALIVREAESLIAWANDSRPLKVFVCFNSTETSETALAWAKSMFAVGSCEIVVGFVDWPPEQWARFGKDHPNNKKPSKIAAVVEREVREKASNILGKIPFRIRIDTSWGRPDVHLAEMAAEEGADLIVVGSHQYRGFERVWHSSVSRNLLHSAAMNVVIVPNADQERALKIAPQLRRVLVATDFSDVANSAISHSYSLVEKGGEVLLLHVADAKANSRKLDEFSRQLQLLVPPKATAIGISTLIEATKSRNVAEGICRAAERFGADVICLGTRGRSGLSRALTGSVAEGVIKRSRRPLFVVPPLAE